MLLVFAILCLLGSPQAQAIDEMPWEAYPRLVDYEWMSVADWHREFGRQLNDPARSTAELAFFGDSITAGWNSVGRDVCKKEFSAHHPINLGLGGDQTQNLLWRIEHGILDGVSPSDLVLLIGVNNLGLGGFSPEETAIGIATVLEEIHKRLPKTRVLLLAIFPAGKKYYDPLRLKIRETNAILRSGSAPVIDLTGVFLEPDGSISQQVMPDYLHLSAEGYRRWAEALKPHLIGPQRVLLKPGKGLE